MKKNKRKLWIMTSVSSILIVFLGAFLMLTSVYTRNQETLQKEALIDGFFDSVVDISHEDIERLEAYVNQNQNHNEVTETPNHPQAITSHRNTIAVMRIPSIDLVAPVGFGVGEADLKKQIGMYTTTDRFLTLGGNTGFAAHTSFRGQCSYCFFNRLRETKIGQEVFVDYKDGNTYRFEIINIKHDLPIDADIPYLFKIENLKLITLSTCSTYGRTRDFVVAKHIETFSIQQ